MDFTWDTRKAEANKRKHRVAFEEACSIFFDPYARLIGDAGHSESEERFVLLGMSVQLRILVVVHCYRRSARKIRIISARRANRAETREYEGFLP